MVWELCKLVPRLNQSIGFGSGTPTHARDEESCDKDSVLMHKMKRCANVRSSGVVVDDVEAIVDQVHEEKLDITNTVNGSVVKEGVIGSLSFQGLANGLKV